MLARPPSVIFPLQIEMSRSRSLSSSSTRMICSSKLLYFSLALLHAKIPTSCRQSHSLTSVNICFNRKSRSGLRNPFPSNSTNNEKVGMFSSPGRAANFPLHITTNCLPAFMLSSLWLIRTSKFLYSNSDILELRLDTVVEQSCQSRHNLGYILHGGKPQVHQ